jgi:hypothetical protein
MPTLGDTAKYVRSKNAGPFWMTIDIFCETTDSYTLIRNSKTIGPAAIARIFKANPEEVRVFELDDLKVIKISLPRPWPQGSRHERDMHSGQQYVQLLDLPLE